MGQSKTTSLLLALSLVGVFVAMFVALNEADAHYKAQAMINQETSMGIR